MAVFPEDVGWKVLSPARQQGKNMYTYTGCLTCRKILLKSIFWGYFILANKTFWTPGVCLSVWFLFFFFILFLLCIKKNSHWLTPWIPRVIRDQWRQPFTRVNKSLAARISFNNLNTKFEMRNGFSTNWKL